MTIDGWIQTLKGTAFHLLDPKQSDFDIEEIAHATAMQVRFNGHVKHFYSVAEHSVLVAKLLEEWGESQEVVYTGLMHDAAEAYIGDMVRPFKRMLPRYREIEVIIEKACFRRFNIPYPMSPVVKKADTVMLLVEKRDLLAPSPKEWTEEQAKVFKDLVLPEWRLTVEMVWQDAKELFLRKFRAMSPGEKAL